MFKDSFFHLNYINDFDKETIYEINLNNYYFDNEKAYSEKSSLWPKDNLYRRLNDAEISCTLKHVEAIKKCSESPEEVSLILEDDVLPSTKFYKYKLKKILKNTSEWDVIFIGQGIGSGFILNKIKKKFVIWPRLFKVDHPATNCAEAYLIKKEAAKKIYNSILPFNMISDFEIAFQIYKLDLNVKWIFPSIFHQGSKSGKYKSELR